MKRHDGQKLLHFNCIIRRETSVANTNQVTSCYGAKVLMESDTDGHVARMGQMRNAYNNLVGKP
jgi:hypothetical protein